MAINKLIFHSGHKKGLREIQDHSYGKGRGKYKGIFRKRKEMWYTKIEGNKEDLERCWKVAEEYLYKLINFAEKEHDLSKEELEEARRIFAFAKQGPRGHTFLVQKDTKLTSADVLYMLSTSYPDKYLADKFGITNIEVNGIRRGRNPSWEWEYHFVKRIKAILRRDITRTRDLKRSVWTLSKVHSPTKTEVLVYTTSQRKAKQYREDILTQKEFKDLSEKGSLDIIYPIHKIELV